MPNSFDGWKKRIAFFLASQTISLFGSSLVQFAIMWYIARTTNSGAMVMISTICSMLPQMIIALFAGVWADRHNRKFLIIFADSAIAISTLVLAIFMINGFKNLQMIFAVSAIRSLGAGIQTPAVNALIPQIVPEDKLMRINGIHQSIMSIVNLIAPAVGGAILSFGEIYNLMFIDVFTAAAGVGVLIMINIPAHKKAASAQKVDYFFDLKEGIKYSLEHSFIRKLLVLYIIFSFLIIPPGFLNVLMVTRVFGDSYLNLTLNEMAFFIGVTIGGLLIAAWGGFKNRMTTIVVGCIVNGAITFAVGFVRVFWIYLILMFFTGITIPMINSPVTVLMQEKVESNMLGRVFSLMGLTFNATLLIGMMGLGPLADVIKIEWLMVISGALFIVYGIAIFYSKSIMREGLKEK